MEIKDYQNKVAEWVVECFGEEIAHDKAERNHRFIEEALELAQACGCTKSEVLQLVEYVFSRPEGEPGQEVGGVMTTLNSLCFAHEINLEDAATTELDRVWEKIEKIREKRANKPKNSPLPAAVMPFSYTELEKKTLNYLNATIKTASPQADIETLKDLLAEANRQLEWYKRCDMIDWEIRDDLLTELNLTRRKLKRAQEYLREASNFVESVIVMRTHFTGEPPYVGWEGLGLALEETLDDYKALKQKFNESRESAESEK